jgi:predicted Zn finger-like uncharacterized protein
MQIVCPNCSTSYQVAAPALGESGRQVRCARCKTVWLATAALEMADATPTEPENTPGNDLPPSETIPADTGAASEAGNTDTPSEGPLPVTADAPPLAPEDEADAATIENGPDRVHEDIEPIAARREAERRRFRLRVPLPVVIVLLAALSVSLIGFRKDVVRHAPQLASFYAFIGLPVNLRGLVFADVKTADETRDGVPVLMVEGTIASTAATPVDVPRLRFALRNAAGAEVYAWTATPSQPVLAPGERLSFRSRLASPPANGRDLEVRFFTHRDAGGH